LAPQFQKLRAVYAGSWSDGGGDSPAQAGRQGGWEILRQGRV